MSSPFSSTYWQDINIKPWRRVYASVPGRRQAIIWTNAGILFTEPLGTNISEILIEIHTVSFKKVHLKMLSAKMAPILSLLQCVNTFKNHTSQYKKIDFMDKILVILCMAGTHSKVTLNASIFFYINVTVSFLSRYFQICIEVNTSNQNS